MKRALITGITGQDGSYLAEFLLEKGYVVHGIARTPNCNSFPREKEVFLHEGGLENQQSLERAMDASQPDEVYNLGAVSHEKLSFESPEYTANINALGVVRLLEIIRRRFPKTKFYQASSAELFGKVDPIPQTEETPFCPRSPYGVSKLYAHWMVINYRETHGLYACNGILFNHESPRRPSSFVSRKITMAIARIKEGLQEKLILGNLSAKRDWGFAKDFVEAMWLMMQQKKSEDFVLATGELHSVRDFVDLAFREVGIEIAWEGEGVWEKGMDQKTKKVRIEVSSDFFRPTDVPFRVGDASKARQKLGWTTKTSFRELVKFMIEADLQSISTNAIK